MSPRVPQVVRDALDRWILLGAAEARAEAVPESRRERAVSLLRGARARRRGALGERGVAALILARSAVHAYLEVVAALTSDALPEHATTEALWALHDAAARRGRLPSLPPRLDEARRGSLSSAAPDEEVFALGERGADEALALAGYFEGWIDVRSPRRIRLERRARQLALCALVALVLGAALPRRPTGPNVAMHASVVVSRRPAVAPLPTRGRLVHTEP